MIEKYKIVLKVLTPFNGAVSAQILIYLYIRWSKQSLRNHKIGGRIIHKKDVRIGCLEAFLVFGYLV